MKEISLAKSNLKAIVDDEDFLKVSDRVWCFGSHGYASAHDKEAWKSKRKSSVLMHRFITDCPKGFQIDHINGNKLDNRRENLRIVTTKENQRNLHKTRNNKRNLYGLFQNSGGSWYARITHDGMVSKCGPFETELEAAKFYNYLAEHFGFLTRNDLNAYQALG
jgi:hypothetical protein